MTTATRTVEIASRQEIGTNIVYQIENDRQERYCVTLRKNGTVSCYDSHNEQCKGTWSNNTCYHILHCIEAENANVWHVGSDGEAHEYQRVEIDEEAIQNMLDNTLSEVAVESALERRYDAWTMRNQTWCCGHWWNGSTCLYGGHDLREVQ